MRSRLRENAIHVSACVLAMLASALVAWHGSGIRETGLGVPFVYEGDGLAAAALFKGTLDHGWYLRNPDLGAPTGAVFLDYPVAESAHFALVRALGFAGDFAAVLNLFYLASFATAAGAAFAVLRALDLRLPLAVAGALAFAWLPYHFIRVEHVFLASYFAVPVYALVALRAMRGELAATFDLRARPGVAAAWCALLALCASTGVYYAFFACVLVGFGALLRAIEVRDLRSFGWAMVPVAVIAATVLLHLAPSLAYWGEVGANPGAAQRRTHEAEYFGLKLIQLVLPSPTHRVPALAAIAADYARDTPLVNENASASLGILGVAGLMVTLVAMLFPRARARLRVLGDLGRLNAVAFAYATIGGLGAIVAFALTAQLRSLNRISVFIAFFAIAGLLHAVQSATGRLGAPARRLAAFVAACAIAGVAWFDQVPVPAASRQRVVRFEADRAFGERIAAALPDRACIFQMPYVPFPEEPPRFREGPYGLMRPYLHGHGLAFSYGAIRGREGDRFLASVEALPVGERAARVAGAGFGAILVHRDAYADGGFEVEEALRAAAGPPEVVRDDGGAALFVLPGAPASAARSGSRCAAAAHVVAAVPPARTAVALDRALAPTERRAGLRLAEAPEYRPITDEIVLRFVVTNTGPAAWSSEGPLPIHLGVMLLAPDGNPDRAPGQRDFRRFAVPPLGPGEAGTVSARFPAKPVLGLRLRVQLVQEHVAWFDGTVEVGPFLRCGDDTARLCEPGGVPR